MHASKRTNRRAVGIECDGYHRMFPSSFAYDHHRRYAEVGGGTSCCAFPDEKRITVPAAPRPNMSTAALERRTGQQVRGTMMINVSSLVSPYPLANALK